MLLLIAVSTAWAQCPAPTGLSISNVTDNSAQLLFTPGANAVSYTVSYTYPGGSMAQVVTPNPVASPVSLSNLLPHTTYTVSVVSNCSSGGTSAASTLTFRTLVVNDDPCSAQALPLGGTTCQATAGTLNDATPTVANGYSLYGCGLTNREPADVWYRFTTAATGAASTGATVTVTGATAGVLRLFAATSCAGPFTELLCTTGNSFNETAPPLVVGSLTPSTTYYVRVSQYNLSLGPFTICVTNPPACGNPTAVSIGLVTPGTAQVLLTPGPGNTSYTVAYVPTAGGMPVTLTPNPTSSPIQLTGLTPLTEYTVTVQANCPSGGPGAVITRTFISGNPQDEPSGAVPLSINASCQPVIGTTRQSTPTAPNGYGASPCAPTVLGNTDIWYSFTTPATGLASQGVTITLAALSGAGSLNLIRLFRSVAGASGPFTELSCANLDFSLSPPATPPLTVAGLSPSTTYYLAVAGDSRTYQGSPTVNQFTICLTPAPACPPPTALRATLLGLTSVRLDWQSTGPGGTFTVEYGPVGFTPGTSAAGATLVAGLPGTSYTATALVSGQPYQAYVSRDCGPTGLSTRVGPVAFQTQVLVNDEPCGALPVPFSGPSCTTPTTGTLAAATQSTVQLGFCGVQNPTRDVWYTFTTSATGPGSTGASVTVTGASATHLAVGRAPDCMGTFTTLGCTSGYSAPAAFAQPAPPIVLRNLTPNTRYYVRVGYDEDTQSVPAGPFSLCVIEPVPCANITNANMANVTATSAQVTFSPAAGSTGYTVTVTDPAGVSTSFTTTARPIPLTGLQPSTTYTVRVTSSCGGGQSLPVTQTFSTTPVGPANEVCAGARPIACGQTVIASTLNTHPVLLPSTTCGGGGSSGLFYRFVGTGTLIDLSTCHPLTDFPTSIRVFSGSCGALSCVGQSSGNSGCSLNVEYGQYSFLSQAGTIYYIFVSARQGLMPTGTFELTLTCPTPPCPAPTALTVLPSTMSPLTALAVSFNAGTPGTTGTTVTVTPSGGGNSTTIPNAVSPLVVTGLAPNTTYQVCVVSSCPNGVTSTPPLCATRSTALPCATATNLVLTPVGSNGTTYQLTWTGAPNALGYAVTYSAAGGPPQSVPAPVISPLSLTLQPGTAYTFSVATDCGLNNAAPAALLTLTTPLASRNAALSELVRLYPNPAHQTVRLELATGLSQAGGEVVLFNQLGQVVKRQVLPAAATRLELNLTGLPVGVYRLQVASNRGPLVKRLLIE